MNKGKILVVDDNAGIRSALKILLTKHFSQVEMLPSPKELKSVMRNTVPDAVLLDMNFHTDTNTGNEGLYWLSEIKTCFPSTEVVLFTAYADISLAVEGMKRGAFDFIVKPWDNDKLVSTLKSAVSHNRHECQRQTRESENHIHWGSSPAMLAVRKTIERIAPTDATVLITGENGTGKDVIASRIHSLSERADKEMVCVDAGAIPESLFESELFGHVKGAFTDAHTDKDGKFTIANRSTLFLDEIGNIPLHLQAKLLRVLQNRAVTKVGDTKSVPIDIRLICATNKDLEGMVREGTFREDLYYRINTVRICLPPLRERKDEIIPLAEEFIRQYSLKYRREISGITENASRILCTHTWRGNVRELQNCIEKAVILCEGTMLGVEDIQICPTGGHKASAEDKDNGEGTLEMIEEKAIRSAMERFSGNLTIVARTLGISRPTLYAKLKKYNL